MDTPLLTRKFEALGARLKFGATRARFGEILPAITLDIGSDHRGEFFDLRLDPRQLAEMDAIDVQRRERHLLLMAWVRPMSFARPVQVGWRNRVREWPELVMSKTVEKPRFLCGHDERHWFVAAVPEEAHASTVRTAMEALKPAVVRAEQARRGVSFAKRFRRKNDAFVRQGEWFFLPHPEMVVPPAEILKHEALQRSGGKAHWAEFACRRGGETVYVSAAFPQGLTASEFQREVSQRPEVRNRFRTMVRDAKVFVRGRISHPDHATIMLREWHEVVMNTEHRAKARANVVFLD